jgi:hypothetical protein
METKPNGYTTDKCRRANAKVGESKEIFWDEHERRLQERIFEIGATYDFSIDIIHLDL